MERSLSATILTTLERHGVKLSAALRTELEVALTQGSEPPDLRTWGDDAPEDPAGAVLPERYSRIGILGVGGMGQVLSVRDRTLGRTVAMKVAHREMSTAGRTRFLSEAQVVAQLQHPGIVPIYDLGTLPSGEPFFTMPIVRGRTLTELIREVHGAVSADGWQPGPSGATFHRLIGAFHDVAAAIGYAHSRQVVHRDLKPDNVIVGEHGETVVVDWGLAKVLGTPEEFPPISTLRTGDDAPGTLAGAVIGTLGYMPPEQARGELDQVGARADVHALGATLFEIFCGAPPFTSLNRFDAIAQVVHAAAPPILSPGPVPPELVALSVACLAKDPEARPESAEVVARVVNAWLEGANRRSRALQEVAAADRLIDEIERLRRTADLQRTTARQELEALPPHAPEERKRDAWRAEDRAAAAEAEAALLEVKRVEALQAALRTEPDLAEAHARLAEHFHDQHAQAERAGQVARANELLHLLRTHDLHGAYNHYVEGSGTVTVVTDPPGADVVVFRYEERDRRLIAVPYGRLGATPLRDVKLPMGSYRLELSHPEHVPTRYPVRLDRCSTWSGVAPGETDPRAIPLLRRGDLGEQDRYVPAGWTLSGGDPEAEWTRPQQWVWVEGFVLRVHAVTNAEYIAFLDDLVAQGREDQAERCAPREHDDAPSAYGRDARGRHFLQRDRQGDEWLPNYPVVLVDWSSACAYAAWCAERSGRAWRLPWRKEREKAARGADGRLFPWGNAYDPSWTHNRESQQQLGLRPVDTLVHDVGPYGNSGLAGLVHDWCLDPFQPVGRSAEDSREFRVIAGGSWGGGQRFARSASHGVVSPSQREPLIGLRLVRTI